MPSKTAIAGTISASMYAVLLLCNAGVAQTMEEWRSAKSKDGCETIPYSSLQQNCESAAREQETYCVSKQSSCTSDNPAGLVATFNSLKDQRGRISSSEAEERNRLQKLIDEKEDALEDLEDKLKERLDVGQRCYKAREYVQEAFLQATKSAKDSGSLTQKDVVGDGSAAFLLALWRGEELMHREELGKALQSVKTCADYINLLP